MRNILIVLKHEVLTNLSKPSFWIMTVLFPGFITLMTVGTQWFTQQSVEKNTQDMLLQAMQPIAGERYSYVDLSGIIKNIPPELQNGSLQSYTDEAAANAAVKAGEIEWYVVIPANYLQEGRLTLVQRVLNPLSNTPEKLFNYLLVYNLSGDPKVAAAIADNSPSTNLYDLAPKTEGQGEALSGIAGFVVPYATLFLFFMMITMSSTLMLTSVSKEKSSRMAEVLLLSIHPRELMTGKLLGLGLIGLLQMAIWLGGALLFLNRGKAMVAVLAQITLPPGFLLWAVLFFVLGYLLYASMMGAIGCLAPDLREASQFTFILMLPLMIPMFLNVAFTQSPNGAIVQALSLFPLTAPTAMMTRLAVTGAPLWQILASLGGLAVTTYLTLMLSARFFRPETLLSSGALKWKTVISELRVALSRNKKAVI